MRRSTAAKESTEVRKGVHMSAKEATTVTPIAPSVATCRGTRCQNYQLQSISIKVIHI